MQTEDKPRRDLEAWARVYAQRDERVIAAAGAGVGVNEIARITGLAKTTVLRILVRAAGLAGGRTMHQCPGPECPEQIAYEVLACRAHWFQVPAPIRAAVYRTWNGGLGAGSHAHSTAMGRAIKSMMPVKSGTESG